MHWKNHPSHSCIVTLVTSSSSPSIALPVSAEKPLQYICWSVGRDTGKHRHCGWCRQRGCCVQRARPEGPIRSTCGGCWIYLDLTCISRISPKLTYNLQYMIEMNFPQFVEGTAGQPAPEMSLGTHTHTHKPPENLIKRGTGGLPDFVAPTLRGRATNWRLEVFCLVL